MLYRPDDINCGHIDLDRDDRNLRDRTVPASRTDAERHPDLFIPNPPNNERNLTNRIAEQLRKSASELLNARISRSASVS